jgi:hypothetical protein
MPLHFADIRIGMLARRAPDKEDDLVSVPSQTLGERLSHEASSAAQQELTDHQNRCRQQICCNKLSNSNGPAKPVGCAGQPAAMVLYTTCLLLFPTFRLFHRCCAASLLLWKL